jgi:hypothetical protein
LAGTAWSHVTITGISFTAGKADVAVVASGQTVKLDDFIFTQG